MSVSPVGIDLLVPGLFGPIPALRELDVTPVAPAVEKCLSRAAVSAIPALGYNSTVFDLFGLAHERQSDLPTAPYCRLSDGGEDDAGFWLQASPVHLRPDGDRLLLFDAGSLEITLDEANQLADMFRRHFTDMPWQLEVLSPQRWYLRLEQQPDILTSPLVDVVGRNIDGFLPQGSEASTWHSILNEMQMLLHMAKVNMLRAGRGQLSVNGLWLHGGGYLCSIEEMPFASVCADEPLLRGMAQSAGLQPIPVPQNSIDLLPDRGRCLVAIDMFQRSVLDVDPTGWLEALEKFDAWLEPLLATIRSKRLGYLNLYPCNGSVYRLDAAVFRRFWRSKPSLGSYIS